jgi:hypothetical protein
MQKMIEFLYDNKTMTFVGQGIYKDRQHFLKCMDFLVEWGIVKKRKTIFNEKFENIYKLTWDGVILWEEYLSKLN